MKADSVFAILSAKIKKVDGSQAQHYSELAQKAAENAAADAAHIEESSAAIGALEATVGDSSAGLVKDVSDLQTRVSTNVTDISELQENELDPKYYEIIDRLSLRENSDTPTYGFNDEMFIDITPGAYSTDYPAKLTVGTEKVTDFRVTTADSNSLYFVGVYYDGYHHYMLLVEYNPNETFNLSWGNITADKSGAGYRNSYYLTQKASQDVGKYRFVTIRYPSVGGPYHSTFKLDVYKYLDTGELDSNALTLMPRGITGDQSSMVENTQLAIETLNLQIGEVIDPMSSLRIDDKLYEVVDQSARNQAAVNTTNIQTVSNTVGDSNSGLVKEVDDLGTQVALNVTNIQTVSDVVGDENSGLVKDVSDLQSRSGILHGTSTPTEEATEGTLYIQYDSSDYSVVGLWVYIGSGWREISLGGGGY